MEIKAIIEALIFGSSEPLSLTRLRQILQAEGEELSLELVRTQLSELQQDYQNRSLELVEVASGWRFQVRAQFSSWLAKLDEVHPRKYSKATLEVLALIAYRQPITRAEIEEVRGVAVSSNIIKTLLEHEWVKIIGYKEVPGRPALFATTAQFLDHFNLRSLSELPALLEFTNSEEEGSVVTSEEE